MNKKPMKIRQKTPGFCGTTDFPAFSWGIKPSAQAVSLGALAWEPKLSSELDLTGNVAEHSLCVIDKDKG
jgi:hypothetical protein